MIDSERGGIWLAGFGAPLRGWVSLHLAFPSSPLVLSFDWSTQALASASKVIPVLRLEGMSPTTFGFWSVKLGVTLIAVSSTFVGNVLLPAASTKGSSISSNSSSKAKYSNSFSKASVQDDTADFSITEIIKATGNFSTANIIGQGGFGTVYRGKLKDGSFIAIKRAKKSINDNHVTTEFKNEIQTLSKIEHLNLVRFLGYLEHADERIILEEYVGNGTLREHLDGSRGEGLEMGERLDIAVDVAHAVTYLHMYTDQPIIHRDIKASNVLITEKLRAKVADFGFARLAPDDSGATHISTQVKGTAGYLDPEYISTYQLTEKSDVYSFGVLLVELVSGRRPIEPKRQPRDRMTTKWAMQRFREGNAVMAMDPRLRRSPASVRAVERVLALAAECLAKSRRSRPSMKQCGEVLWGIRKDFRDTGLAVATAAAAQLAERQSNDEREPSKTRSSR